MAYDGIIFDFNGTLFFDSDKQEQAWHTVSRQLRGKGFTSEEMYERVHGRSSRSIFEYLLRKPLTQEQVWELIERKETIYRELCLQDEERFRLATIATASEIRNVRFFREHFGLDRWFDPRRIVYDDGTFSGKPAPDIYLRAAERIGLSPSRCIVAEDARSGIEAARRAGAGMIVAVASTMDRGTVGRIEGVDVVIDRLDRLDRNLFVQYPKA